MSEANSSDTFHSQLAFPLLLFAVGVILCWIGYSQYLEFNLDQATFLMIRPEKQISLLMIAGGAFTVVGILGLIRGYLYR